MYIPGPLALSTLLPALPWCLALSLASPSLPAPLLAPAPQEGGKERGGEGIRGGYGGEGRGEGTGEGSAWGGRGYRVTQRGQAATPECLLVPPSRLVCGSSLAWPSPLVSVSQRASTGPVASPQCHGGVTLLDRPTQALLLPPLIVVSALATARCSCLLVALVHCLDTSPLTTSPSVPR